MPRLEVAWTVSQAALDADAGYASAVLHLCCRWDCGPSARCEASLVRAGTRTRIEIEADATVGVERNGRWTHVTLDAGDSPFLSASFDAGRLAYCTSSLPARAGLGGGSYDAPTGILELYEAASPAVARTTGRC